MDNVIVSDVMEVFAKSLADPTKMYFFGIASQIDWTSKIQTTLLKGGIGNYVQGVLADSKEMTFKVTPLFFGDAEIAMLMGSDPTNGNITFNVSESGLKVSGGKVTIAGTPATGTTNVNVFDMQGKHYVGTYATGTVTITSPPADGTIVTVVYPQSITGNIVDLAADLFPTSYEIWAHTIAKNPDTNAKISDIYLHLYKAMPDGNLNVQLKAGSNINVPITFNAMTPLGSKKFGEYISVPAA